MLLLLLLLLLGKFVVLLNKPIVFLKFSLLSPLSLLISSLLIVLDYPRQLTTEHSFSWITTRLYTIKTKEQRNWSTTFYTNTTTDTSPNLQGHTVTQLNSTHFSSHIYIRNLSFIRGGKGWYNVFSQVNFFFCPSPISCKKNRNPSPCMAQKSYVPPHAKRYDRDY